jgi:hypothetical protein
MRLKAMLATIAAFAGAVLLARCFEEPNYIGRACAMTEPCPDDYVCSERGVCERACRVNADCPSGTECVAGRCFLLAVADDGGVTETDGGSGGCTSPADCVSPDACEVLDDRVACIEGACRYPPKTCDEPPPGECIDNDTKYRSYSGVGRCENGACVYAEVVIDCLDCRASCLLRCEGLTCNDSNGGCRSEGHCIPEQPPVCEYVDAPDSTACDRGGVGGGGADGFCKNGECVGCAEDANCDDGSACTSDVCMTATSSCAHTPVSGACDDGDACTRVDACANGFCVGGDPIVCDTAPGQCFEAAGTCDPADGTCVYAAKEAGATCSDDNACTTMDGCVDGDCIGGPPLDCDDQNECTDDGCDAASGCTHTNNTLGCEDGDACTVSDVCAGGGCTAGTALNCDDGNPCTTDGCDPATGCTHANVGDGTTCMFAGGMAGMCSQGSCVGCTLAAHCDDGNPCTDDTCNGGTCAHGANTAACNDGDACTHTDRCSGGTCGGTAISCVSSTCVTRTCNGTATCSETIHNGRSCTDDGNACTDDICNASGTCTHPSLANATRCGANSANRCCGGTCVNISTSEAHCGGCNTACAAGLTCESVSVTSNCSSAPANTSGRCRCNGVNSQCPRGQICRNVNPYSNRCAPDAAGDCATGAVVVSVSNCPDYCRY